MKVLMNINDFENLIANEKILIALVGSDTCNPCKALGFKIDEFIKDNNDIKSIYVPIECFKEYLAGIEILSIPTVLVYVMGKMQIKESGYFSLNRILNQIIRIKELID